MSAEDWRDRGSDGGGSLADRKDYLSIWKWTSVILPNIAWHQETRIIGPLAIGIWASQQLDILFIVLRGNSLLVLEYHLADAYISLKHAFVNLWKIMDYVIVASYYGLRWANCCYFNFICIHEIFSNFLPVCFPYISYAICSCIDRMEKSRGLECQNKLDYKLLIQFV